jgi:hypothetical protein
MATYPDPYDQGRRSTDPESARRLFELEPERRVFQRPNGSYIPGQTIPGTQVVKPPQP